MINVFIITDLHYTKNLISEKTRMCYLSLDKFKKISHFAQESDLNICLGDLVNGTNDEEFDLANLKEIKNELDYYHFKYVLGNHDAFSFDRKLIINTSHDGAYYSFMQEGIKFIVLDANYSDEEKMYSRDYGVWTNAYINSSQKEWLVKELNESNGAIILVHQVLDDHGFDDPHTIRNAKEIRKILEESKKVKYVFQGHYHKGYDSEINGIKYHTLKGMCENYDIPYCLLKIKSYDDIIYQDVIEKIKP